MKKHPIRIDLRQFSQVIVLAGLFVVVLFAFQNCGSPMSEGDELSSVASTAPFPYKGKVDTIAYMSCQNMSGYDTSSFFTFRASADKSTSGLALRNDFVSSTGGYNPAKRAEVIKLHPHADGGHLQLAVRAFADFQSTFRFGSSALANFDFANYPTALSDDTITSVLSAETTGNFVNSFSPEIKLDLDFLPANQSGLVRDKLAAGEAILALSMAPKNSIQAAPPVGLPNANAAVGQGFIVGFSKPSHIGTGASTIMSSINEFDMETRSLTGSWSCPSNLRFLVVLDGDQGVDVACTATPTSPEPSPSSTLTQLRKVLPSSDWAVDMTNRCVVSKKPGSCYGPGAASLPIRYPTGASGQTCDPALNTCPHYISICIKN